MATNRVPLIVDQDNGNKIRELPLGDNLDLTSSKIVNASSVETSSLKSAS